MPLKPDLSFTGLEEFTSEHVVIKSVVENSEAKASEAKSKTVRKNNGAPIIEDWVSDKFAKRTHPCPKENMVPRAVLMKSGLVSVNIARQVNVAHSKTTVNAARPKVNTVKDKNVNAARPKVVVNAAKLKAVVNAVKGNNVNAVKALAYHLGKFDGKADEGFFIGYSLNSKSFRVFNSRTRIVEENLHIRYQSKGIEGTKHVIMSQARRKTEHVKNYILLPLWPADPPFSQDPKSYQMMDLNLQVMMRKRLMKIQEKIVKVLIKRSDDNVYSTNNVNAQNKDGIFVSQDKYVGDILKKFGFTEVKTASTLMETQKCFLKDEDGEEVDVHMYRSMIGSLMYLTSSRPDIMFAVCACARYQVNPKVSHLHVVKRIFRYLKGQPKLGLWYSKDSPFDLVAYTDSDYAGASLDKKSTTGGCQFLGCRLISWQCKKQTVVANSITEAEYVAASSCCGQVLWIQNQLLDYRINLLLLLKVNATRHKLTTAGEQDAEGVDCLPNATIFEQLTLMGYEKISQKLTFYKAFFSPQWKFLIHTILQCLSSKTTAWNEFSSTMASAIICLATNQKFNFSKYIFESMVKNLDNVGKFLMYPRFIQVFLDKQLEGMPTHNRIYIAPSHTKKIFRNMRRVGKGFSGRETPLFQTMVVQDQAEMGEGSANPTDPHHTPTFIQPSTSQPQKKQKPRKPKRKDTQIPQSSGPTDNVADEAVNEEMDDSLERAATTATSLDAEQDRGNINKTQSKATPNEAGSQGTTSGGGPRRQETMGILLLKLGLRMYLKHPMIHCSVLGLETIKTTQANEIESLKRRVKKLKRRNESRTHRLKRMYRVGSSRRVESSEDEGLGKEDASKQGRINAIDADEDITLVNDQDDADMFGVNDLDGDEVIVDNVDVVKTAEETRSVVKEVTVATTVSTSSTIPVSATTTTTTTTATITDVEITLAQALAGLKSAKPKAVKVEIQEPEQGTTTTTHTTIISVPKPPHDKGKGIMIEEPVVEQVKPIKRFEQIRLDEELAFKLQAKEEEEEEERLAREKAHQTEEANIAWDDVQAKIEADYQLAQRLQAQEQEELTDEEKSKLFIQFLEQRRKHFTAKRAEEKRNGPQTRAQQRSIVCTYLKNMEGWKPKNLKNKSFSNIQELFDKEMKRVNTFVDYKAELVEENSKKVEAEIAQESSSKRAGDELEQENANKQKVDKDKETIELQSLIEVVPDDEEEVVIDVVPLITKPPTIVD
ncbi:hypothetical protein Tco_0711996 [Tanacetum coccineum]